MIEGYSGATRVIFTVGNPVAQVSSPIGVTAALRAKGHDMIVVPAQVPEEQLASFVAVTEKMPNVVGMIITVPHKISALRLCREISDRAKIVGATNVLKRLPDGGWFGDMVDGEGYVAALRRAGCEPAGLKAMVVGAGGAGAAIATALAQAGVSRLEILEPLADRRQALLERLQAATNVDVSAASSELASFDLVINATPLGMRPGDALPFAVDEFDARTFVGDVVDLPVNSTLIAAAQARGCKTMTGRNMFEGVRDLLADFFVG